MGSHLEGKSAIVTGAGRGIERGIAIALASEGASVVVNDLGGSVDGQGSGHGHADEVVAKIAEAGGEAQTNYADVADHRQAEDLVRQALDAYGKLDILVNVAGILRERMIFNMTEDEWDAVIRVHLKGTYNTTHFASIHWRQTRNGGRLIGFTKSCANALARYGVTSNAIAPGASTRMTDRGLAAQDDSQAGRPPSEADAGGERDAADVAPVVVYLCSDEAANVSGRVIGTSGYQITLYSEITPERQIFSNGPWDIDQLFKRAPETIFAGLTPPSGERPAGARVSADA